MKYYKNMTAVMVIIIFLGAVHAAKAENALQAYVKGLLSQQAGDYKNAAGHYSTVIAADPDAAWAYLGLGQSLQGLGLHDQAFPMLEEACDRIPETSEAYISLAETCEELGLWKEAIQSYQYIRELDSEMPGINHNIGVVYFYMGRWEQALSGFYRELLIDPYSAETYYMIGLVFSETGDRDRMHEAFAQARLLGSGTIVESLLKTQYQ